jgi:hypothetical protein
MHARTVLALLLSGCCFGGAHAPAPVAAPASPTGPTAPGCLPLATAIVGTWTRAGFVEEYRADGTYVINGQTGTIVWATAGRATLDVPGTFHAAYDLALADPSTLLAADPNGVGSIYSRASPPPSMPAECFDLRTAWVGTWTPTRGGPPERYTLDGRYAAPGVGAWSFTAPGRLHLQNDNGIVSEYVVGLSSSMTALAVSLPPLPSAGVAYLRTP